MVEKPSALKKEMRYGCKIIAAGKQFIVTHSPEELDEMLSQFAAPAFLHLNILGGGKIRVRPQEISVYGRWSRNLNV